ncbi:MAG: hypothetical protein ACRDJC_21500, partial [Thermomicrobiales bacterium]
ILLPRLRPRPGEGPPRHERERPMNLLANASIKRHWNDTGKIIPGTHCCEVIPPEWSPPRVQIYDSEHAGRVMEWVNILLSRPDIHVCAVSPAAVCALRESDSMNNPLLMPHYTVTVIYQERITPETGDEPAEHPSADPEGDFAAAEERFWEARLNAQRDDEHADPRAPLQAPEATLWRTDLAF